MILLTVNYDPNNEHFSVVSDGFAERYVESLIEDTENENPVILNTSQESVVDWVRVFIARKKIPHDQVEFRFGDNVMYPDKFGKLDWYPPGFCDYRDKQLEVLLLSFFAD